MEENKFLEETKFLQQQLQQHAVAILDRIYYAAGSTIYFQVIKTFQQTLAVYKTFVQQPSVVHRKISYEMDNKPYQMYALEATWVHSVHYTIVENAHETYHTPLHLIQSQYDMHIWIRDQVAGVDKLWSEIRDKTKKNKMKELIESENRS